MFQVAFNPANAWGERLQWQLRILQDIQLQKNTYEEVRLLGVLYIFVGLSGNIFEYFQLAFTHKSI